MGHTILLADDEKPSLMANLMYLKELGDENDIVGAPDGETAYQLVLKKNPDLVVIDWMMPRMTGVQVLSKMRSNPQTKDIPVIMVTALAAPNDLQIAFDNGVTDYLKKPVDKLELLARARAALKSHDYFKELKAKKNDLQKANEQLTLAESRLKELNTIKNTFFGVLSTDLNEPLNSLAAFVNLLFKNVNNFSKEEMKYVADNIKSSLNSVSSLLKNLIHWSEAELHKEQNLTIEAINFKKVLVEKVQATENLQRKAIQFTHDLPDELNIKFTPKLFEAFLNAFLENCSRLMGKSSELTVSVETKENNTIAYFRMNNFNMADEHLNKLFSLEHYLEQGIKTFEKSVGLGFLLCQRLLEISHGGISVEKEEQEIVCFKVLLPLA